MMEGGRVLLSERYPAVYPVSVACHRAARRLRWIADSDRWAAWDRSVVTPHRVTRHSSVLLRELSGVDVDLQRNKVHNLRLAVARLDGRVMRPGQRLSFWRAIGNPSARRGYLPGLVLNGGRLGSDIGGGLCQLSNLLYWMALHTPLAIVERHHHGFDVFPDSGRVLPFGSGATVFFNYVDLVIANPTPLTFRVRLWLTSTKLCGAVHADALPARTYHVRESDHRFFASGGSVYRENRLHRATVDRETGEMVDEELIAHNVFPVLYPVGPEMLTTRI